MKIDMKVDEVSWCEPGEGHAQAVALNFLSERVTLSKDDEDDNKVLMHISLVRLTCSIVGATIRVNLKHCQACLRTSILDRYVTPILRYIYMYRLYIYTHKYVICQWM